MDSKATAVREAAQSAAREWLRSERAAMYSTALGAAPPQALPPQMQKQEDDAVERLAAIITRHLATPVVDDEGEQDVKLRLESIAEPWICAEEKPCEEAVPVHWDEMITALVAAGQGRQ